MENTISLCMIVKNEEQNIARCLKSVAGAVDEIIIVDTGSTDKTEQIARRFGARVYSFAWNDNFSDARNVSIDLATGDWIMFLDADEELAAESRDVLRKIVSNHEIEGYFIKIINYLGSDGWIESCPDLVFRLFRNREQYRFRGAIHEQIVDVILERNSNARYQVADDLVIMHYGYLSQQIAAKGKIDRNLSILAREMAAAPQNRLLRYHYGVELYRAEKYGEAVDELIKAADGVDPQTVYLPKLIRYIVLAAHAARDFDRALTVVRQGLNLFPHYADLCYYGGLAALEQKHYARAGDYFRKALAMPPQPAYYAPFSGMRGFRSHYQLGRLAEKFLDEEEAMGHYIRSLRDNPAFVPALESIILLLKPWEDPVYAGECLDKICDFCTPQANLMMGNLLYRHAAYRLALEYLDRGTGGETAGDDVAILRAVCLIQQSRYLEALRIIEGFNADHPSYPYARLNKLLCFWFQGNHRKVRALAEELFALGLSRETGGVVALLNAIAGESRWEGIDLGEEGMTLLLDVLTRTIDLGEKEKAVALLGGLSRECAVRNAGRIGRLFYRYGCLEEAEACFRDFLSNTPRCGDTVSMLGDIKQRSGENLAAAELYQLALDIEPGEPCHYVRLVRLYESMRMQALKEAAQRHPDAPLFNRLLEEVRQGT